MVMTDELIDILLVEDCQDDAVFFTSAVAEAKPEVRVRVVRDGMEVLALIFGVGNPDHAMPVVWPKLVLLDMKLPKLGGLEILRRLKANLHTRSLPVVVFCSSQDKRDLVESYHWGANSYLVKPMDIGEFRKTVRLLCEYWLQFNQPSKP